MSSRGPSLGMWEATGEGNLFLRSASVGSVGGPLGQHSRASLFPLLYLSEPRSLHQQNGIIPTWRVCSFRETKQERLLAHN